MKTRDVTNKPCRVWGLCFLRLRITSIWGSQDTLHDLFCRSFPIGSREHKDPKPQLFAGLLRSFDQRPRSLHTGQCIPQRFTDSSLHWSLLSLFAWMIASYARLETGGKLFIGDLVCPGSCSNDCGSCYKPWSSHSVKEIRFSQNFESDKGRALWSSGGRGVDSCFAVVHGSVED